MRKLHVWQNLEYEHGGFLGDYPIIVVIYVTTILMVIFKQ